MDTDSKIKLVVDAIQEARKISLDPNHINLYLAQVNGLNNFDPVEVNDILILLEKKEKVIRIEGTPYSVDMYSDSEGAFGLPLPNSQTYFSLHILDTYNKWVSKFIPEIAQINQVVFDVKTGKLTINNLPVSFRRGTFKWKFIDLLLNGKTTRKKEWFWDEIIEKLEFTQDTESTSEYKKKFYPACDGIQKSIAQKTGINDFLIYNNTSVRINPKYL